METDSSFAYHKMSNGSVHNYLNHPNGSDLNRNRLNAYMQRNKHTPLHTSVSQSSVFDRSVPTKRSKVIDVPKANNNVAPHSNGSLGKFFSNSFKYPNGEQFIFRRSLSFCKKSTTDTPSKSLKSFFSSGESNPKSKSISNYSNITPSKYACRLANTREEDYMKSSPSPIQFRRKLAAADSKDQFKVFSSIASHSQSQSPASTARRRSSLASEDSLFDNDSSPYCHRRRHQRNSSVSSDISHLNQQYPTPSANNYQRSVLPKHCSSKSSSVSPQTTPSGSLLGRRNYSQKLESASFCKENPYARPLTNGRQACDSLNYPRVSTSNKIGPSSQINNLNRPRGGSSSEFPRSPGRHSYRNGGSSYFFPSNFNVQSRSSSRGELNYSHSRKNSFVASPVVDRLHNARSPLYSPSERRSTRPVNHNSSAAIKRNHSFCHDSDKWRSNYGSLAKLSGSRRGRLNSQSETNGSSEKKCAGLSRNGMYNDTGSKTNINSVDKLAKRRGRSPPRTLEIKEYSDRLAADESPVFTYATPRSTPVTRCYDHTKLPHTPGTSGSHCFNLQDSYPAIAPTTQAKSSVITDTIKSQSSTLLCHMKKTGTLDGGVKSPSPSSVGFDLEALLKIDDLRNWIQELETSRAKGYQTLYSDYDDCPDDDVFLNGKYQLCILSYRLLWLSPTFTNCHLRNFSSNFRKCIFIKLRHIILNTGAFLSAFSFERNDFLYRQHCVHSL